MAQLKENVAMYVDIWFKVLEQVRNSLLPTSWKLPERYFMKLANEDKKSENTRREIIRLERRKEKVAGKYKWQEDFEEETNVCKDTISPEFEQWLRSLRGLCRGLYAVVALPRYI